MALLWVKGRQYLCLNHWNMPKQEEHLFWPKYRDTEAQMMPIISLLQLRMEKGQLVACEWL